MKNKSFTPIDSVSLEQWLETLPQEERPVAEERMRARIASRMGLGILENLVCDRRIIRRATWESAYENVCSWLTYFMVSDEERRQMDVLYERWSEAYTAERKAMEYGRFREAKEHEKEVQALEEQRQTWGRDMRDRPLPESWDVRYPRYLALLESEHERGRKEDRERAERQADIEGRRAFLAAREAKRASRAKRP